MDTARFDEEFISDCAESTRAFAADFAKKLSDGAFVALSGDLGAGKTTFVKGLAEGLGVKAKVKSPSFNIMSVYDTDGGGKLVHIDAYRLDCAEAFENLAIDEIAPDFRCLCVEWWENVADIVPCDAIHIAMSIEDDGRHSVKIKR